MNREQLQQIIARAQAERLLPEDVPAMDTATPPWPVLVLTTLGAWLAVIPLLIVAAYIFGIFGTTLASHNMLGTLGVMLVAGTVLVLRGSRLPYFLEQVALPVLMLGIAMVTWFLMVRLGNMAAAAVVCIMLLTLSALLRQHWLRTLLGAAAAIAAAYVLERGGVDHSLSEQTAPPPWVTWHVLLAIGLTAARVLLYRPPGSSLARVAAWAETVITGWLLCTLACLALWTGISFLPDAGLLGLAARESFIAVPSVETPRLETLISQGMSAALMASAGGWLSQQWPKLRQPWWLGSVLVLTAVAAMVPSLGACVLVMALCAGTKRWRLSVAAALASAWILGAFYYSLQWPLATKAAVLVGAGLLLAALSIGGLRTARPPVAKTSRGIMATPQRWIGAGHWGIVLSALLTLVTVNLGIWQKEMLLRHGLVVFVPIEPVDPRSLMQGDYMALNFLPREVSKPESAPGEKAFGFEHPRMVFTRDDQDIVSAQGPDHGQTLSARQLVIELVPKRGRWILVTDAFYFKEGEAERWAQARFGEFRVDAKGHAILVGLRGEGLKPL